MSPLSVAALRQGYLDRLTDRYRVITTGGITTRIGPLLAERQTDLERQGWTVRLVDDFHHELFTRPDLVVPLLRAFLDWLPLPA